MDSDRPIKAGQTRNTRLNSIVSISRFQVTRRAAVGSLKFSPSLQPVLNSNLRYELLLCCEGIYFPEAFGNAACVVVVGEAVVTSRSRTVSDGEVAKEVAAGLGRWEDAKRDENGFGNMVNGAV